MVILDANVILRYLMKDSADMSKKAKEIIDGKETHVTIEVLFEVVYAMRDVYAMKRKEIADSLREFLKIVNCEEKETADLALKTFGNRRLDFIDCVLYAYHRIKGAEIATFDNDLMKMLKYN